VVVFFSSLSHVNLEKWWLSGGRITGFRWTGLVTELASTECHKLTVWGGWALELRKILVSVLHQLESPDHVAVWHSTEKSRRRTAWITAAVHLDDWLLSVGTYNPVTGLNNRVIDWCLRLACSQNDEWVTLLESFATALACYYYSMQNNVFGTKIKVPNIAVMNGWIVTFFFEIATVCSKNSCAGPAIWVPYSLPRLNCIWVKSK
jgi:hypothetical protein